MKKRTPLTNWITIAVLFFVFNTQAQNNTKIQSVKSSIDEIIENIHAAADTIEHIDQLSAIYETGDYAKLKNLIEYYDDLGGSDEQVAKYEVHYRVLGDRVQTRIHKLDIGNIIDLDYQAEVAEDMNDLTTQLENVTLQELHFIKRDFELVEKVFTIKMKNNTVVGEWKDVTSKKLLQLKEAIEQKSELLEK